MAHVTIAGLPVQVGLYTIFLPMLIYAALGTSRPLSVSTTTTIAILTGVILGQVAPGGDPASLISALATLGLLVGGMLVLASFLRLGFIANFISEPVLIGFKAGIGLVIVVDQIPKLLGIHFQKGGFLHNLLAMVGGLSETSMATLAVGAVMIVILVGIKWLRPRAPAPLIAVALGIAGMGLLGLHTLGVKWLTQIPRGFPSFSWPDLSLAAALWPGALGIAVMSFTETIAAGRAFAKSEEPPIRPNQELLATGLANAGGALIGAMPAGGGTTQTGCEPFAGARSQLAEIVTAAAALVTMFLLAPPHQPDAGGHPGGGGHCLLDRLDQAGGVPRHPPGSGATDLFWALAAFAGVVLLGTLKGILVAIIISLAGLAYQVANRPVHVLGRKPGTNVFRPRSKEHPEDEMFSGLLLLRLEGRVFFANAERIREKIRTPDR